MLAAGVGRATPGPETISMSESDSSSSALIWAPFPFEGSEDVKSGVVTVVRTEECPDDELDEVVVRAAGRRDDDDEDDAAAASPSGSCAGDTSSSVLGEITGPWTRGGC